MIHHNKDKITHSKKKKGEMQLSTAIILNAPGQRQQQIPDMIP